MRNTVTEIIRAKWDRGGEEAKKYSEKYECFTIPLTAGIFAFLLIYGFIPLNAANDRWILAGYDESDIIQHYAGWMAYRNSEWKFPLGYAEDMAVGTGTVISYTDSIPIVAILFKLFRRFLPQTFQYFGIYILLCYILQSVAAFKIIKYKTGNNIYSAIGTLFFSFAPILMERAFRHTALGSQWLILFSIYLYLKHRDQRSGKTYFHFLFLEILAIGIHPYFLPMVAAFALLCAVCDFGEKEYRSAVYLTGIQVAVFLFGVIIGVLGRSDINVSREGYGFFSMNMNAIINPVSCGQYTWSVLLKDRPQILGNYDGFNYLGAGVLVFIVVNMTYIILLRKRGMLKEIVKRHWGLILVSGFLVCFAISNVVSMDDKVIMEIYLSDAVLNLCGIFRASSRMFYPVYYLILISMIILWWRIADQDKKKYACHILFLMALLQVFDLHECIMEKHCAMKEKAACISYNDDPVLAEIAQERDSVILEDYQGDNRSLAVWAYRNNMDTYFSVANSGSYDETVRLSNEIIISAKESGNIGRNVIVTTAPETADGYRNVNAKVYEAWGSYFIYSDVE